MKETSSIVMVDRQGLSHVDWNPYASKPIARVNESTRVRASRSTHHIAVLMGQRVALFQRNMTRVAEWTLERTVGGIAFSADEKELMVVEEGTGVRIFRTSGGAESTFCRWDHASRLCAWGKEGVALADATGRLAFFSDLAHLASGSPCAPQIDLEQPVNSMFGDPCSPRVVIHRYNLDDVLAAEPNRAPSSIGKEQQLAAVSVRARGMVFVGQKRATFVERAEDGGEVRRFQWAVDHGCVPGSADVSESALLAVFCGLQGVSVRSREGREIALVSGNAARLACFT